MTEQLIKKIAEKNNPTVVGLDPTLEMMPEGLKNRMFELYGKTPKAVAEMFIEFNAAIMDAVVDIVPAVKPQIAMYERYGLEGIRAYMETTRLAKEKGFVVIGDIKRGDISSTAEAYAAHLGGVDIAGERFDTWNEDIITIAPYLGSDGITPFCKRLSDENKGIFVLVVTSNPSSSELQCLISDGKPIYEHMGALVEAWGEPYRSTAGYSRVGAVVGATHPEQGALLRKLMPHTFFLLPGYGAQGATGKDIKGMFDKDGGGAIVNSSRGIIAAYKKDARFGEDFALAARESAITMQKDLSENIFGGRV